MRSLLLLSVFAMLAACGVARQSIEQEADPPPVNLNDALAECRNGYPDQITQAVPRSACGLRDQGDDRALAPAAAIPGIAR